MAGCTGWRLATTMLLLAGLLAGCLESADRPQPASADAAPAPPVLFRDCTGFAVFPEVPQDRVREQLPPGYEPLGGITSVQGIPVDVPLGLTPPGVSVDRCTILLPDGTRHEQVLFGVTKVALVEAGGHEIEDEEGFDDYVLELFFDVEALPGLAQHFAAVGWPVHDAEMELTPESFRISADGIEYAAERGVNLYPWEGERTGPDDRPTRYHHVSTAPSHGTLGDVEVRGYALFASTLTARGGFFGAVSPTEGASPLSGLGQLYGVDGPSELRWAEPQAD